MSGAVTNPPRELTYPFPETVPSGYITRLLRIPNDQKIITAVSDVLAYLCKPEIWELNDGQEDYEAQALLNEMLASYFEAFYMIGTIHPVALATIPDNMLLCDGATYDRVDYPELYDAIDTGYHIDADTFNVPNLVDRVPVGSGGTFPVNSVGGEINHTLTIAEMPAHDHPQKVRRTATTTGTNDRVMTYGSGGTDGLTTNTIDDTGGGQSHNNMQPYIALKYCIVAW